MRPENEENNTREVRGLPVKTHPVPVPLLLSRNLTWLFWGILGGAIIFLFAILNRSYLTSETPQALPITAYQVQLNQVIEDFKTFKTAYWAQQKRLFAFLQLSQDIKMARPFCRSLEVLSRFIPPNITHKELEKFCDEGVWSIPQILEYTQKELILETTVPPGLFQRVYCWIKKWLWIDDNPKMPLPQTGTFDVVTLLNTLQQFIRKGQLEEAILCFQKAHVNPTPSSVTWLTQVRKTLKAEKNLTLLEAAIFDHQQEKL